MDINNCCEHCDCLLEFCELIDCLVQDIQHLETQTIKARHDLCTRLPYLDAVNLKSGLVSDLARTYDDNSAYRYYVNLFHGGQDPLDSQDYVRQIYELMHLNDDIMF